MEYKIDWGKYTNEEVKEILKEGQEILNVRDTYRKAELVRQINEAAAALKREFPNCRYWEDAWDDDGNCTVGFEMMEYFPMDPDHLC